MYYLIALIPSLICVFLNTKYYIHFTKKSNASSGKTLRVSLISNLVIQIIGIAGLLFFGAMPESEIGIVLLFYSNASVNTIIFLMFLFYMELLFSMAILQDRIKPPHIKVIKIIGSVIFSANVLFSYVFVTMLVAQVEISPTLWTVIQFI